MEKLLLFAIILIALLALLLGIGIRPIALHAIDTSAAQPESVSEAIEASQSQAAGAGVPACLPLAALLILAAGWLLTRSGEALRQYRLTFGRRPLSLPKGRRPIRPIPTLPTVPAVPALPETIEE